MERNLHLFLVGIENSLIFVLNQGEMKNKLIKISDTHYIIVDDSEIKEGDYKYCPFDDINKIHLQKGNYYDKNEFKITHSTQPLEGNSTENICCDCKGNITEKGVCFCNREVLLLSLSEVEEAINGYSVEKMAESHAASWQPELRKSFIKGFKAHQELVKDKLFTRNDLIDFAEKCLSIANDTDGIGRLRRFVIEQSKSLLPKTEWNVEIIDGKIKLI